MKKKQGPRILLIDIETSPLEVYTWNLYPEVIGLNQIIEDWSILSYAAKWIDEDKIMYMDTSSRKNPRDDKKLVASICKLLDECDVVVSHYGKKFDVPKIDTRREFHRLPLFSMPKHEDTKFMANKFAFTSNKLEYIAKYLNVKNKKLVEDRKFQGMELWKQCLKGNRAAWNEMCLYNKQDVHALQDVYDRLSPRASTLNPALYYDDASIVCRCGNKTFKFNGYKYTETGKFHRYKCKQCHKETRGRTNLFSKLKRQSLRIVSK